jgi:hypothetical protein
MNIKLHNHVPKRFPSPSAQPSRIDHPSTVYLSVIENAVARQNSMSCVTSQIRHNLCGLLPIDSTRRKLRVGLSVDQFLSNGSTQRLAKIDHSYTSGVVTNKRLPLPQLSADSVTPNLLVSLV